MDKAKIFLEDGMENVVNCIFYLYNSKYYFLYTQNEVDENGYVKLYLTKVGKETTNTENGPVETGNMIGIEIPTNDEWKEVQGSISKIVNSKKTKIEDKDIQVLPINMLVNLKVVGKKTFRLLSNIIENDFGVSLSENLLQANDSNQQLLNDPNLNKPIEESTDQVIEPVIEQANNTIETPTVSEVEQPVPVIVDESTELENISNTSNEELAPLENSYSELENTTEQSTEELENPDIIIDYRTRFFEEQEKNKKLMEEIEKLNKKLESIDEIIKGN